MGLSELGWDGMGLNLGWIALGWVGYYVMGWDGIGWAQLEWDGTVQNWVGWGGIEWDGMGGDHRLEFDAPALWWKDQVHIHIGPPPPPRPIERYK